MRGINGAISQFGRSRQISPAVLEIADFTLRIPHFPPID
jgi:hypothetical protein